MQSSAHTSSNGKHSYQFYLELHLTNMELLMDFYGLKIKCVLFKRFIHHAICNDLSMFRHVATCCCIITHIHMSFDILIQLKSIDGE